MIHAECKLQASKQFRKEYLLVGITSRMKDTECMLYYYTGRSERTLLLSFLVFGVQVFSIYRCMDAEERQREKSRDADISFISQSCFLLI